MLKRYEYLIAPLACLGLLQFADVQPPAQPLAPTTVNDKALIDDVDQQKMLQEKFKKLFTGAKLRGRFTVDGKPMNELKEEAYEISKVEKLPDGDWWAIEARIQYGKYDLTVPVPLEVKWAGETPVLTLNNMTIPTMGTFSARVVLHQDKYAGTWQHDQVGGHLFGIIELSGQAAESSVAPAPEAR